MFVFEFTRIYECSIVIRNSIGLKVAGQNASFIWISSEKKCHAINKRSSKCFFPIDLPIARVNIWWKCDVSTQYDIFFPLNLNTSVYANSSAQGWKRISIPLNIYLSSEWNMFATNNERIINYYCNCWQWPKSVRKRGRWKRTEANERCCFIDRVLCTSFPYI